MQDLSLLFSPKELIN
jgi:hypothetical protein